MPSLRNQHRYECASAINRQPPAELKGRARNGGKRDRGFGDGSWPGAIKDKALFNFKDALLLVVGLAAGVLAASFWRPSLWPEVHHIGV